jgi:hypothetical protein
LDYEIGKEMTRAKTQSTPSLETEDSFSLRPWRLGGRSFLEVVFFKIQKVRT